MINQVSDGQPITYELLNQIIEQVNKVSVVDEPDIKQIVTVKGVGIDESEGSRTVIAVGQITVNIPRTSDIPQVPINFPVSFTRNPYISLTIVDTEFGVKGAGINAATVTVTDLTKSNMKIKVRLIRQVDRATSVQLHYMAIGPVSNA